MAVTSLDKRWLEANDRLCEILDYSREELLQTNWVDLTYPDDVEPNFQLFDRLLAGEIEHFTLNKRYVKKDGSIVYAKIYTRAFRKDDGTIDHIVTLIEDMTARTQAESRLAYLASFPETNPNPVIEVGLGGDIQYVNPAAHRLFPDLREQGRSHPWLSDWEVAVRPFCEGRTETIVRNVTVADRTYQQSFHYIARDRVVRIYSLDVTELKHAEALRASTERYELAVRAQVSASGIGIFAPTSCTSRPVGRCSSAMARTTLATALRIGPDSFIRTSAIGFSSFKRTFLRARRPRLPPSTACVTKTVPTAGSWPMALCCAMSKAKPTDSSDRMETLRIANVRRRLWNENITLSSTCLKPATTNANSSPTTSMTDWPRSWPVR